MTLAVNHLTNNCARVGFTLAHLLRFKLLLLFLPLSLLGCGGDKQSENTPELHVFTGQIMGTWYTVKYLPLTTDDLLLSSEQINPQIHASLVRVDKLMSTYKSDSEVSRFNAVESGHWFDVSNETFEVISLAQRISEQTAGRFDITVAPLVDLWGFGPDYKEESVPDKEQISELLNQLGYHNLELDQAELKIRKKTTLRIDLSAIAKGFAVDQVADYLDELGVISYMVEVGGEIRTRGTKPGDKPWRIAIESPDSQQRDVHSILDVTDQAVATSGDYRNYFEKDGQRYSHTIDPQTGYPIIHNLASVTVVGQSAAEVDALATAFSVMGADQAMHYAKAYNVAAYFIVKEEEGFTIRASDAFIAMNQKEL